MQKLNSQSNNYDSTNKGLNPKTGAKKTPPKTLKERIRWLFTKDGLPTLLVIVLGFVVGFFVDGSVGIILSTVLGLVILSFLKKFHLPTKPWQATVSTLLPIIARLSFMMIFFLPVATSLYLPSGHYPNTLMKYLSIMIVVPSNIIRSPAPSSVPFGIGSPGIPIVVALSIILMFWGSLNLDKRKNLFLAFAGLILFTLSPIIGGLPEQFLTGYLAIGYYLAWVGLALVIVNKLLPRILKMPASMPPSSSVQKANRLMSIMPFFGIALFLTQLQNIHLHLSIIALQDFSAGFESAHHEVAGVLSGAIAGIGAGVIIDNVSTSPPDNSGSNPPDQTPPPDAPTVTPSPPDTPPTTNQPPTPPEVPPTEEEIKNAIEQHKIDEQYKSAYEKDHQKSINDDITKAANDDKAFHDVQDHLHDDTKKFWKDFYTNENEFNSWEAEHEIKKAEGFEKLENVAKTTKKGCDWFIWGAKYVAGPVGKKIADAYEVTSEFAGGAADGGLKEGLEKGGIKAGEKLLEHVTMHTLEHTVGHESDAGKFIKYVNEEGEPPTEISLESLNNVAVDMTKDKIKGLGPEAAGKWAEKKLGLEEKEGGSEGGSEGASAPAE